MSLKPSHHSRKSPGQPLFYVCLGIVAATGLGIFLWPYILWGSVGLSLKMGWATWGDTTPSEPWDGCVPPISAAERDEWVAQAKATGETLCDPDIVEMEFPEATSQTEEAEAQAATGNPAAGASEPE